MAARKLRLWPDGALRQMCDPVDLGDPALPALIEDLFETMYAENGRGLAAPQIGVLHRVFVVDVTWKEGARAPQVFINPDVVNAGQDSVTMDEQCLSIPDLPMPVRRPNQIKLRYNSADGTIHVATFDGLVARCIQHELDHLNGKTIFDHQFPADRAELEAAFAP